MFSFWGKAKRRVSAVLLLTGIAGSAALTTTWAQQGRGAAAPKPAAAASSTYRPDETLAQLMKGILFASSNVVFAAQNINPADVKPAKDPSLATDPLENTYGKWEAVENAGLAISEAANLLLIPGRKCSNGRTAPSNNSDWPKLVQGVREAGQKVYAAAKTKEMEKIIDAADVMTTACANCHEKYREKPTLAERCM